MQKKTIFSQAMLMAALVFASAPGCGDKSRPNSEEATPAATRDMEEKADKASDERALKIEKISGMFDKSLHKTGAGMKHWYDKGSKAIVGKEYEELDCKNCHVKSCSACHTDGDKFEAPVAKDSCLECHTRFKATAAMDKAAGIADPHAQMPCTKCHPVQDMHCDGKEWVSMRDKSFLKAQCLSCHEGGEQGAKKYDPELDAHAAHDNLTCAACHTSNTIACLNCHFDSFLATGSRKGNFVKGKDWLLLVNYQGKVTSGTVMSIVSKGKKYATVAPYSTHSIMAKGRSCADCHENDAVKSLTAGETVSIGEFEDGTISMRKGVIPVMEGKISVPFLEKDADGKWVEMKDDVPPMMTFSGHAEPLSSSQLEKLNQKVD